MAETKGLTREMNMFRPRGNSRAPIPATYSPNVFIPLATACTQACSYCRFRNSNTLESVISPKALLGILERGRHASCTEALLTHGQDPDKCDGVRGLLQDWGFSDSTSYLVWGCEQALARGLLPHVNPGVIKKEAMIQLKDVTASMGLMLETIAQVVAHRHSPFKDPAVRLRMIELAGELKIPFTTGLLIGIGESWRDRIRALHILKDIERKYHHIQEVILQPVIPTSLSPLRRPSLETMLLLVRLARKTLPGEVTLQVPGNLFTTEELIELLRAGANDLGGISAITPDYINPDHPWPTISSLQEGLRLARIELVERLPVYPRCLSENWCTPAVLDIALQHLPPLSKVQ